MWRGCVSKPERIAVRPGPACSYDFPMRTPLFLALVAVLALGCDASPADTSTSTSTSKKKKRKKKKKKKRGKRKAGDKTPEPKGGATVFIDPDTGKTRVEGGKKRTGDPKDCAAYAACCSAPQARLFCGLNETLEGDCGKLLKDVRQYLSEARAQRPSGC